MKTRNYTEIASNYRLWMEYADPSGLDSEEAFNAQTVAEKVAILTTCFGPENCDDHTMSEITVTVAVDESEYRAERSTDGAVVICRRMDDGQGWEQVGSGHWDGQITDCAADLGDDVYAALDSAIADQE